MYIYIYIYIAGIGKITDGNEAITKIVHITNMEKTTYNKKKFMIWFKEGKKEKRHDYEAQDEAIASKIIAKITFLQVHMDYM